MTFAGNWPVYARPELWMHCYSGAIIPRIDSRLRKVLENAGHGYVVFYMIYITFVVFAVAA